MSIAEAEIVCQEKDENKITIKPLGTFPNLSAGALKARRKSMMMSSS
jgi:hypothetical protein